MTIYPETRPNWHDQDEPDAVHLGQGVYALPGLKAKFSTDLGNVTLELSMEAGRYVVRSLTLGQHRESPPITSELLRRARVQEWVNAHVPRGVRVYDPEADGPRAARLMPDEWDRLVSGGATDDLLKWVARLYLVGQLLGGAPAKFVRDQLEVPTSTAGSWIRRAKDRGFIDA